MFLKSHCNAIVLDVVTEPINSHEARFRVDIGYANETPPTACTFKVRRSGGVASDVTVDISMYDSAATVASTLLAILPVGSTVVRCAFDEDYAGAAWLALDFAWTQPKDVPYTWMDGDVPTPFVLSAEDVVITGGDSPDLVFSYDDETDAGQHGNYDDLPYSCLAICRGETGDVPQVYMNVGRRLADTIVTTWWSRLG